MLAKKKEVSDLVNPNSPYIIADYLSIIDFQIEDTQTSINRIPFENQKKKIKSIKRSVTPEKINSNTALIEDHSDIDLFLVVKGIKKEVNKILKTVTDRLEYLILNLIYSYLVDRQIENDEYIYWNLGSILSAIEHNTKSKISKLLIILFSMKHNLAKYYGKKGFSIKDWLSAIFRLKRKYIEDCNSIFCPIENSYLAAVK